MTKQIKAFVEANKIVSEQSKKLDTVFDRFMAKQTEATPDLIHVTNFSKGEGRLVVSSWTEMLNIDDFKDGTYKLYALKDWVDKNESN
jgi:hypothetical protein